MVRKDKKRKKLVLASLSLMIVMLGSTFLQINATNVRAQNWWEDIWEPLEPITGAPETGQEPPAPIPRDNTKPTTKTTLKGGHTETYKDQHAGGTCHTASYTLYKTEEDITIRVVAQEPGVWWVESGIDYVTVTIDHDVGLGVSGLGGRFNGENTFLVPYKYGNVYELTIEFLGEKGNHYMEVEAHDKAGHKSIVENVWVRMERIPDDDECVKPGEEGTGKSTPGGKNRLNVNDCSSTKVGYFTVAGIKRYKNSVGYYYFKSEYSFIAPNLNGIGATSYEAGWYRIQDSDGNTHHAWTPGEVNEQIEKVGRYSSTGLYLMTWNWIKWQDPGTSVS